jgi:ribosome-associated protein
MARIRISPGVHLDESELEWDFVRASGPGGQHVNKASTAAQVRLDVANSPSLPAQVKRRVAEIAGSRLTDQGVLVIDSREHRSQKRNRDKALDRLIDLLRRATVRPKRRKKTRPTATSRRRRLEGKKHRGRIKKLRGPVRRDD